jgi:hypothetical protein
MSTSLTTWVAAIGTLALLSFAWRENKFYSLFEHIYVASGAAHALVQGVKNIRANAITPLIGGQLIAIVPIILGLLFYTRFIPGKAKWSRYPIAATVGVGLGQNLPRLAGTNFMSQIRASFSIWTFNTVLVLVSIICVILYFYFSASEKAYKIIKYPTYFGRLIMMMAFGALFGNTVMGRLSLMIGRVSFLLQDWLGIVG